MSDQPGWDRSTWERMPIRGLSVLFEGTCKNVPEFVSARTVVQCLGGSIDRVRLQLRRSQNTKLDS